MKRSKVVGLAVAIAIIGMSALAWSQGWFTEPRAMLFKNRVQFDQPVTYSSAATPIMSELTASKPVFTSATKELTSTGTIPVNQGGTNLTSYAIGDILYASAATTIAKLADVAAGQPLLSGGVATAPAYAGYTFSGTAAATYTFPSATKTLAANDGSNLTISGQAIGDIPVASGATAYGKLADVAVGQVLVSGGVGAAPAYSGAPVTATHSLTTPRPTAGSGTGVTVSDAGSLRTQVYKVTVAKENFTSAGVTHDLVIGTMPAKSIVHSVLANVSEAFVCGAVCTTATLSATLGVAAGGVEYLESFDIDAATGWFGDADAEVGSKLDIAANTNGGYPIPAGGAITLRATSGTGNWGDGASATNLTSGALEFYVLYSILP